MKEDIQSTYNSKNRINKFSPISYASPELFHQIFYGSGNGLDKKRGSSAFLNSLSKNVQNEVQCDIWSLGCIFAEMFVSLNCPLF